jgi:hypothetical protein
MGESEAVLSRACHSESTIQNFNEKTKALSAIREFGVGEASPLQLEVRRLIGTLYRIS